MNARRTAVTQPRGLKFCMSSSKTCQYHHFEKSRHTLEVYYVIFSFVDPKNLYKMDQVLCQLNNVSESSAGGPWFESRSNQDFILTF